MQTEASQHSRSSSGFESLDGVESARGKEIRETVAFNTKAAPRSANAPVIVSTVSFPSSTGLSQRSKHSYIGATTTTVAMRSNRTVHTRVLATAGACDESLLELKSKPTCRYTQLSSHTSRGTITVKTLSAENRVVPRFFNLQHGWSGSFASTNSSASGTVNCAEPQSRQTRRCGNTHTIGLSRLCNPGKCMSTSPLNLLCLSEPPTLSDYCSVPTCTALFGYLEEQPSSAFQNSTGMRRRRAFGLTAT